MRVIGLTGGIATGKSSVSSIIEQENVPVIDCDKIAHAVVKKGRWGYRRVVKEFGQEILRPDGELDRAKLGALIFPDPSARRRLNKATHLPVFLELFRQLLMCWLRFCAVVVVDMPLLFETKSHKYAAASVLVACDKDIQVQRLMLRDSCSKEQAESKVGAQMPLEEKRKLSDIVIDNNGSREELRSQTVEVVRRIRRHGLLHQVFLGPGMVCVLVAGAFKFLASRH